MMKRISVALLAFHISLVFMNRVLNISQDSSANTFIVQSVDHLVLCMLIYIYFFISLLLFVQTSLFLLCCLLCDHLFSILFYFLAHFLNLFLLPQDDQLS